MDSPNYDSMSDAEIRSRLIEMNYPVGPVTPGTRKYLIKKLKSLMDGTDSVVNTPSRSRSSSRTRSSTRGGPSANSTMIEPSPPPTRRVEPVTPPRTRRSEPIYAPEEKQRSSRIDDAQSSPFGVFDGLRTRTRLTSTLGASRATGAPYSLNDSNSHYQSEFIKKSPSPHTTTFYNTSTAAPSINSHFFDVKESDDEDTGPSPVYTRVSQGHSKGFNIVTHGRGRARSSNSDTWALDSPASALLLFIFCLFFILIGVLYLKIQSNDSTAVSKLPELTWVMCSDANSFHQARVNCVAPEDKTSVQHIFEIVMNDFNNRLSQHSCTGLRAGDFLSISNEEVINLVLLKVQVMSVYVVENHLSSLKILFEWNPNLGVRPTKSGFEIDLSSRRSLYCSMTQWLSDFLYWSARGLIVCGLAFLAYVGFRWQRQRSAKFQEEVSRLASNIVDVVSSKSQSGMGKVFVPVHHVRDQLIPFNERTPRMKALWDEAVALLQNDSRMRQEIQEVDGEQFLAWVWLTSGLTQNKKKVWQGQAFDTMQGSNSLQHSPTSCLKIRHMFKAEQEEGDDWVTTVVDAILEKCGSAQITHIAVDRGSTEGCVYMKCLTPADAGKAYQALHGSWFASNLVTVKYIRESRYLERFPESERCKVPLRPSNNSRNSLQ